MTNEPRASCSHLRVTYRPVQKGDGYEERWPCEECSTPFLPASRIDAAQARAEALELESNARLTRAQEAEAQVAALTARLRKYEHVD